MKNVGSASTRKPVAHRLSTVELRVRCAPGTHTPARARGGARQSPQRIQPKRHGNAERLVLGGVGHENPTGANLLASVFNLISINVPHTVTPHTCARRARL
eukprot:scaffold66960_cov75-Phaeocystis_antarctica.AAC.1